MSGGSYDYLCFVSDVEGLSRKRHALNEMADRLEGLPWAPGAAMETRRLASFLDRIDARLRASQDLLEVWRAIEWWDSGDNSEETTRKIIERYEDGLLGDPAQEPQ